MAELTPILFLAWYFPPVGGAGVQRSLKFTQHLPGEGIQPVVLAGPAGGDSRWTPADASLLQEVDAALPVYRPDGVPAPPGPLLRLRQRITGELTAVRAFWQQFVLASGERAAVEHGARAIFVTLGPFECLQPALQLGRRLRLPVIADLRDPWAFDEMRGYSHRLMRALDQARMRRQLSRCDVVVMNTPVAEAVAGEALPELRDRLVHVTNGYDAGDFGGAPPAVPGDGVFRIVHAGYLHCDLAQQQAARSAFSRHLVRGEPRGLDLWGRTHRYLLQALELLERQQPGTLARVELQLHGVTSPADAAITAASPVRDRVHATGYRPHRETVVALRQADLLFLPMQGLPAGQQATIVPGKTYEYLASARPILAAVPAGDARDFVLATGAGRVVEPADVAGMAAALGTFIAAGRQPDRALGNAVTRFERRVLTRSLAAAIRRVL
ncbi:MAG TPA: glycosyltransferase [Planctomycetota bacterium]|nr:glycosyltransferase [Planctomycetota bacterium]